MNRGVKFTFSLVVHDVTETIYILASESIYLEDTLSAWEVGSVVENNEKTGSKMTTEATVKCP